MSEAEYNAESFSALLVDSEGEVDEKETPKTYLQKISAKFDFKNVEENQCHLMAQMMESWFLADKEKLAEFYGQGFNRKGFAEKHERRKDCEIRCRKRIKSRRSQNIEKRL